MGSLAFCKISKQYTLTKVKSKCKKLSIIAKNKQSIQKWKTSMLPHHFVNTLWAGHAIVIPIASSTHVKSNSMY